MRLWRSFREWRARRKQKRLRKQIHRGLERAHSNARLLRLAAGSERVIVLSDQHKGARDGADDFQRCERTYNAALTYYKKRGYRLVLLGDVEELWENSFEEVSEQYPETLALEAAFLDTGDGYVRVWGNHDMAWSNTSLFEEKMGAHGLAGVEPVEAVRLRIEDLEGGPRELFLTHGHQGTDDSDRNAVLSRLFVRYGWRWLQRKLNRPWNTPAVDWALRGEHANHMYEWARGKGLPLVAGHTHKPVFFQSEAEAEPPPPPGGDEALTAAHEAWAAAEERRLERQPPIELKAPCYFNTGCCSFGDGDITGIEVKDGEIALVRWPCKRDTSPVELAQMKLSEVFSKVDSAPAAGAP